MSKTDKMSINDYSRKMASYVLNKIKEIEKDNLKNLSSLANKLPAMIHYNGLALSVAYLYSKRNEKARNPEYVVLEIITEWFESESIFQHVFSENLNDSSNSGFPKHLMFLKIITEKVDTITYRSISNETIKLFEWVRRLSSSGK